MHIDTNGPPSGFHTHLKSIPCSCLVLGLDGLSVLLSFAGEVEAKNFAEAGGTWSRWFVSLDPWVGQAMPFEHLAWINIFGVPPHIFSSKVFNLIGGRFGRLVHESQVKTDDGDLTFDCVGVLTDSGNLILGFLKLKWQDKSYRVWVNEEPSAWVPDCTVNIDELDDRSSAFSSGGRFPASPVVDGPVDKEDDEPLSNNVQSVDPPGVAEFVAHGVVGEGPLHVDKSSCFSPPWFLCLRTEVIYLPTLQIPRIFLMMFGPIMWAS
ncbi:hypothetical protein HanOQP8_Chr02g0053851 [Helianthus annuus]|nr:hypothetical protein HanOQP8_Chr02g0053851 [Helianthus annuus]